MKASQQLKNRILLLTYIYRSVPYVYLQTIAVNATEREQIRGIVKNLITQKYLLKKTSRPLSFVFLHLSLKGHTYVRKYLVTNKHMHYYQHKSSRSLLKPILTHSFLNFAYLWHFHKNNVESFQSDIALYEDSDINNCKIRFSYKGNDVLISPDVIIYMPEPIQPDKRQAIFVENDTGRETYETIYHKLLEYIALAEEGMDQHRFTKVTLSFVFLSKRRMQQMFDKKTGIVRFFDLYNKTGRNLELRIRYILRTLRDKPITIYISHFDEKQLENPYIFQQYDLLKHLLQKEASWATFLS